MNRRKFLKNTTAFAALSKSLERSFVRTILAGAISKVSTVKAEDAPPRNFVLIGMNGGFNARIWNGALNAHQSGFTNFNNTGIGNSFAADGIKYRTTAYKNKAGEDIMVPVIWDSQMPAGTGGMKSMRETLKNALFIQGIKMPSDGHPNNYNLQIAATSGGISNGGQLAAYSSSTFPAVMLGNFARDTFKSPNGVTATSVQGGDENVAKRLMNPLTRRADRNSADGGKDHWSTQSKNPYMDRRVAMQEIMGKALKEMQLDSANRNKSISSLYDLEKAAEAELSSKVIFDILDNYTENYNHYKNLMKRAFQSAREGKVNGITSLGIGLSPTQRRIEENGNVGDFNSMLSTLVDDATLGDYCSGLALSESLIKYKRCQSMGFSKGGGIIESININTDAGKTVGYLNPDCHTVGLGVEVFYFGVAYYVMTTLLQSFSERLGAADWNNTVVQYISEFTRAAKPDQSGSDHGWEGGNTAIFSGAIPDLTILGNLTSNHPIGQWPGVWGAAGHMKGLDSVAGHTLNIGNVASTVSTLLRIPSPTGNFSSLGDLKSDQFVAKDGMKSKIVDGNGNPV